MKKLLLTLILITVACFTYSFGQKALENKSAEVSYVVDGDTVRLRGGEYVRLIGINSPELKSEDEQEKCFAYKAKEQLLNLLKGKEIRLEADNTQADRDRYNRLLRYIFVDNENINLEMIKLGYAYEYTYSKPYKYQKEFRAAEKTAREKHLGVWDERKCY
jgi:micrococcal nuclease